MENSNRAKVRSFLIDKGFSEEYIKKYFGADGCFNTTYESGILRGKYFIHRDVFIGLDHVEIPHWRLKEIVGIDELKSTDFDTHQACKDAIST